MKTRKSILIIGLVSMTVLNGCAAAGPVTVNIIEQSHKKEKEEAEARQREIEEAIAREKEEKVAANERKVIEEAAGAVLDALMGADMERAAGYGTESGIISAILLQKSDVDYYPEDKAVTEDIYKHIISEIYSNIFSGYTLSNAETAEDRATIKISAEGIKDPGTIEKEITSQEFRNEWQRKCEEAYMQQGLYTPDSQKIEAVKILKGMYTEKIAALPKESWTGTITLEKDLEQGIWLTDSITDEQGYAISVRIK